MTDCQNCASALSDGARYCSACGQRRLPERLSLPDLAYEFVHALFHVDHSVLSLIRALATRPGEVARRYVSGMRKRYFGPFAFLVIVVAIAAAEFALTGFQAVASDVPNSVGTFLQHHVNLLFFFQVPLLAGCHRLLGSSQRYNYAEYLVLAAYTSAMLILLYCVVIVPASTLLHPSAATKRVAYFALFPVFPIYYGMASSQFLAPQRLAGFAKGAIADLLARGCVAAILAAVIFLTSLVTK